MIKLTITISIVFLMSACGVSTTPESIFRIEMWASGEAPEAATGDEDPRWEKFTLTGVSMLNEDGSESHELYDGTDPQTSKIVNRPQLVYQKNMDEMAELNMTAVSVIFDTAVTAGSADHDDLEVTLATATHTLTEEFTIEEGQVRTLQVRVNWGNTVADTTLQEPEIVLDFP